MFVCVCVQMYQPSSAHSLDEEDTNAISNNHQVQTLIIYSAQTHVPRHTHRWTNNNGPFAADRNIDAGVEVTK